MGRCGNGNWGQSITAALSFSCFSPGPAWGSLWAAVPQDKPSLILTVQLICASAPGVPPPLPPSFSSSALDVPSAVSHFFPPPLPIQSYLLSDTNYQYHFHWSVEQHWFLFPSCVSPVLSVSSLVSLSWVDVRLNVVPLSCTSLCLLSVA